MARQKRQPNAGPHSSDSLLHEGHDRGYKALLGYARVVRDLLTEYVHHPLVSEADLFRLERVPNSFIGRKLIRRESDIIWKAPVGDGSLYIYFPFEFQSTVPHFMAVRAMLYQSLVLEELVKCKELTPSGKLPPVIVIVLYNGKEKWTAPLNTAELIEMPGGNDDYNDEYVTSARYLLLDENEMETDRAPLSNLAARMVKMEKSRTPKELELAVEETIAALSESEDESLRRTFADWLTMVLVPRRMPGAKIPAASDLEGVKSMLAERVQEWVRPWRQEGVDEGMKAGVKAGEAALLLRQLERKLGPLSADVRERVGLADAETLLVWGDRVLDARTLEDVLG